MTDRALLHHAGTPAEADVANVAGLGAAVVIGGGLAVAARAGNVPLLVAVAVAQALTVASWFLAVAGVGRRGGAAVAVAASAAADVAVMQWPHGRLGPLLPVLALAIPVMFVHQLARGAARVRLIESLTTVALLLVAVVALPAFVQLRHEFAPSDLAGHVALAAAGAAAGALVTGFLVDLVLSTPRFDPAVGRGLPGLVVAAVVGGCIGYVVLRNDAAFGSGRSVFVGAGTGILAGLLSVAASFATFGITTRTGPWAARLRPVFAVCLPLCVVAPGAFLICLAIRS